MAGPEYEEKRGPNLGSRTIARHGAQGTATVGSLMTILQSMVNMEWLTQESAFFALGALTVVGTTLWKWSDKLKMEARVNKALEKHFPSSIVILLVCLALTLPGCAVQLGTAKPEKFVALDGTMLIACETKGVYFAVGDADICSNSMRGGHVGRDFVDMTLGVVQAAGSIVAGFFTGLGGAGAGMQAAVAAQVAPAAVAPHAAPPAPVAPAVETAPEWPSNPFTAPSPE